jgi:hypothetical protein
MLNTKTGLWIPGQHQAIIRLDEWMKAQWAVVRFPYGNGKRPLRPVKKSREFLRQVIAGEVQGIKSEDRKRARIYFTQPEYLLREMEAQIDPPSA